MVPTPPPAPLPGSRPPTMEDVAARAGVSRALVSIVFGDRPGAGEATRQRVREAAAALGYAPDQRARLLGRKRSRLLGVSFGVEHPFHGALVEALYAAAEAQGYDLALSAVAPTRSEDRAVASLLAYRCEALVLLGPTVATSALAGLGSRVPLVVVARNVRSPGLDVVRTDDVAGARQATEHLVGLGHRRIAHVDGGRAPGTAERRRGYRDAMDGAGLGDHRQVLAGGLTERDGAAAVARLLAGTPADRAPTAVLAFNDLSALGVLRAAADAGLDVPGDLSVVGYDDSRAASLAWVDLTTVRQDTTELAVQAVTRAVARLRPAAAGPAVVVAPRLIPRGSTAPPAAGRG